MLQRLAVEDGAAQGKHPLSVHVGDLDRVVGTVGGAGAAENAALLGAPEVGLHRVVEVHVAELKGVHAHLVLADLHALAAASADVAAQAAAGLLANRVFRIAQLHLLKGGAPAVHVQQRHFRPFEDHFGGGGHLDVAHPATAHRHRRGFGLGQAVEIAVDGLGGPLAAADGFHHGGRAGDRVAGGENAGNGGLHADGVHLDGVSPGPIHSLHLGHALLVHPLADGADQHVGLHDEFAALDGAGRFPVGAFHRHQLGPQALEPGGFALPAHQLHGHGEEVEVDALLLGLLHLFHVGGHFGPGSPVGDGHLPAAQPQGRAGRVDGHVAAAHHHHLVARLAAVAQGGAAQQLDGVQGAVIVLAGDVELVGLVGADGEEEGLEALFFEVRQGHVLAEAGVEAEFHAQVFQHAHFPVDDLPGQPVAGNAHHDHAARGGQGLQHPNLVALESQIVGAGHAAGAGPDHADFFVLVGLLGRIAVAPLGHGPLGGEGLEEFDGDGGVDPSPHAHELARARADQAADPGERVVAPDHLDGLGVPALADEGDVGGHVDARRAGHLAGGGGQLAAVAGGAVVGFHVAQKDFPMFRQRLGDQPARFRAPFVGAAGQQVGMFLDGRNVLFPGPAPGHVVEKLFQLFGQPSAAGMADAAGGEGVFHPRQRSGHRASLESTALVAHDRLLPPLFLIQGGDVLGVTLPSDLGRLFSLFKMQTLGGAGGHAGRPEPVVHAVHAVVAFDHFAHFLVPLGCAPGAGGDAGFAADAEVVVHEDDAVLGPFLHGAGGAGGHAPGIFAVKAGHEHVGGFGDVVDPFGAHGNDLAEAGAFGQPLVDLARHFAGMATDAFFGVLEKKKGTHALLSAAGFGRWHSAAPKVPPFGGLTVRQAGFRWLGPDPAKARPASFGKLKQ